MRDTNDKTHQDKIGDHVWALVDTNNGCVKVPVEATIQKIHKRRKNQYTIQAGNVTYEVQSIYLNKDTCFETAILSLQVGLKILFGIKKKLEGKEDLKMVESQILNIQSTIDMLLFSSRR